MKKELEGMALRDCLEKLASDDVHKVLVFAKTLENIRAAQKKKTAEAVK